MRRRRRQSTQIIRKKTTQNPSSGLYNTKPPAGTKWKKILYGFFTIIILGLISYYFYQWGLPGQSQPEAVALPEEMIETVVDTQETQAEEAITPLEHKIQIEILNGCGVDGVAKIFQSILREQGFDVVNTENYTLNGKLFWQVEKSFIIDQIGVAEYAKLVAKALGIPADNIENRENPAAIFEVSIVIGKDYKKYITQ